MQKLIMQPEFTNHCNFKCIMCPQSVYGKESKERNIFNREKGYMTRELFDLFLENAKKYAKRVLIGFFGEPLLHPKFNEFIEAFPRKRDYDVVLFTNWSLVTLEHVKALKLCDSVRISLDASYAELWNELCPGKPVLDLMGRNGEDRYDTIVSKLYYWLGLLNHPPTQIVYTMSSINESDRDNFIKKFLPLLNSLDRILTKAAISYGGVIADKSMLKNRCNITDEKRFTVAWNGDCTPCNLDVNVALNVGNVFESNDIKNIVQGNKYKQIMKSIKKKEGVCAKCFDANNWTEHRLYKNK